MESQSTPQLLSNNIPSKQPIIPESNDIFWSSYWNEFSGAVFQSWNITWTCLDIAFRSSCKSENIVCIWSSMWITSSLISPQNIPKFLALLLAFLTMYLGTICSASITNGWDNVILLFFDFLLDLPPILKYRLRWIRSRFIRNLTSLLRSPSPPTKYSLQFPRVSTSNPESNCLIKFLCSLRSNYFNQPFYF